MFALRFGDKGSKGVFEMTTITLTIDGKEVKGGQGDTILEVCKRKA